MELKKLISKDGIVFLESSEMKDTVNILTQKTYDLGLIKDKNGFENAILAREELVSTGVGMGISIPHAKLKEIDNFFIIVGIAKNGLDWDSIDRKPVRAVFMIGGPDGSQQDYLKLLSKLILLLKNDERRSSLFSASNEEQVPALFAEF